MYDTRREWMIIIHIHIYIICAYTVYIFICICVLYIILGKLQYFSNLNSSAIWGWFPLLTMIPVRENSEVVIIYADDCMHTDLEPHHIACLPMKACPRSTTFDRWICHNVTGAYLDRASLAGLLGVRQVRQAPSGKLTVCPGKIRMFHR